jgi:hypothetical protein
MKTNNFGVRDLFLTVALAAGSSFFVPQALSQQQPPAGDAGAPTGNAPARITEAVDEKSLVTLKGNVHPLARAEFDQGAVSYGQPLHRMLLLLQRSPDQEAALQKMLEDQQNKSSANYHAWLTPAQFGQQFGPADADIQTVTNWLQSHGFQISNVTAGRTVIEFSGNAAQVRNSFHTEIHKYLVNGEAHTANATDPQIPAALTPVVAGPVALNNFHVKSHVLPLGLFFHSKTTGETRPLTTFPNCGPAGCFGLGPADFATIYNSAPLLSGTPKIDGTGQTIAIVGESNINVADVTDFRTIFNLPQNFSSTNIILNGPDPGINGSEGESDLDVQWAGAAAPGATIDFVTSQPTETTAGIFLSATYIVDNNIAAVMSESFGACEQQVGTLNQFHNLLWEQAAAQGITVMVSSGDGGSAGCDNFDTAQTATHGLGVSGFASTPFNVAVGGTDFDQINKWSQFWNATNDSTTQASAVGYIPEIPWNDSCAQLGITGCGASAPQGSLNIVAGSGGASTLYPKPSWQSGTGVPLDNHRDVPDVSLFASNGFDASFYIICQRDASGTGVCNLNDLGFTFQGIGGTSASAPAFAGIMALVNQSQATAQNPAPRQGNANYVLYQLFKKQTNANPAINCNASASPSSSCTFYDVTRGNSALANGATGTNSVPCAAGSPNCSNSNVSSGNGVLVTAANPPTPAYSTTTGYDLATGLGSVNVANLVKNWSSVTFLPSTTTLSATVNGQAATSISGITHGTPVSVSSIVAAGQAASGTPSGQVELLASPNPAVGSPGPSLGFDLLTLTNGTGTDTNVVLPGGQYSLTAHYQGDGTFGASDSTPGISVNISAEPSKTLISIPVFDPTTGRETGNAPTSLLYGSPYIARIDVGNANASSGFPPAALCTAPNCPTGTITWTDAVNGGTAAPLDGGSFALNSSGYTEDQPIQLSGGSHMLSASYSGDKSYNASSATYSLTVNAAPTSFSIQPFTSNVVVANVPFQIFVNGSAQTLTGLGPTGTVTFFDGGTQLGSPVAVNGDPGHNGSSPSFRLVTTLTLTSGGGHMLTAQYSGDANYAVSTSTPLALNVLFPTTTMVSANPTVLNYGDSVTVNAVVSTTVPASNAALKPTGNVNLFLPSGTAMTTNIGADTNGNWQIQTTATFIPQQSGTVGASYTGDANYASSSDFSVGIIVNIPDFSLSSNPSTVSITAGQTGTATLVVTPATNLTSPVTLSCGTGFVIPGVTCKISPTVVTLSNGIAANSTLSLVSLPPSGGTSTQTVSVQVDSMTGVHFDGRVWWTLSAFAGLATLFLSALPSGRRRHRLALASGLVCLLSLALGCGGGSSLTSGGGGGGGSGGGGGGNAVPTTVTLSVASVKVPQNSNLVLTATVNSTKPITGTVTFLDASFPGVIAPNLNLTNGTAQAQTSFLNVGTHVLSVQYSGDTNNQQSTSGNLNVVITGTTSQQVGAQTSIDMHLISVSVTIQ